MSVTLQDHVFPVAWFLMWMKMSIVLNTDYPITRSPLQIPFSGLFILEVDTISYLKGWVIS